MKDRRRLFLILLSACSLYYTACSNSPPEILQSYWQLSLVEQPGSSDEAVLFHEELSLFTVSRDEDGEDEIESLFLIQDEEELFWELNEDNWEKVDIQGETWMGASRLVMPLDEFFPRDEYRLLVIDKSGQRSENTIGLAVKKILEPPVFPRFIRDPNQWTIESPHSRHTIRLFNPKGELKKEIKLQAKFFSERFLIEELKPSAGDTLVLLADNDAKGWVLQSLPIVY